MFKYHHFLRHLANYREKHTKFVSTAKYKNLDLSRMRCAKTPSKKAWRFDT